MVRRHAIMTGLSTILIVTGGACHHQNKTLDEVAAAEDGTLPNEPVVLEVENRNWSDVVIYLLVDGRRYRFLQVQGAKDVSAEIPRRQQGAMGTFRFAVHRIGTQEEYVTETVSVRTGRTIRLTLESELRRSSIAVF